MADRLRREYAVAVIGLGGIGSGAAYWLSRRLGPDVLGLEQFELGHANGASQDHSRIIRLSYHRPDYVRLAKRAYETWSEVEAEAGVRLVMTTGGLDLWPAGATIPMVDYVASLSAESVPFETLDAAETMRRWPQWRLADDTVALFQAAGGLADPNRANAAHQRLARGHGATLLEGTPVTGLRDVAGEVELTTVSGGTFRAGRVILAADAWTNELLASFDRRLPLTITQEQVTYFGCPRPEDFAPDRFPVWIWMDEPSFYGFPTYGEPGPKAAQDVGGRPTTARDRTFEPDRTPVPASTRSWRRHLPGASDPSCTRRPASTRCRPTATSSIDRAARPPGRLRRPGGRAWLQVRFGDRPNPGRARGRRRHTVGGRSSASGSTVRSCSRPTRRPAS